MERYHRGIQRLQLPSISVGSTVVVAPPPTHQQEQQRASVCQNDFLVGMVADASQEGGEETFEVLFDVDEQEAASGQEASWIELPRLTLIHPDSDMAGFLLSTSSFSFSCTH